MIQAHQDTCPACGLNGVQSFYCPQCGAKVHGSGQAGAHEYAFSGIGLMITRYLDELWLIISQPRVFFKKMPVTGGLSAPLAFALITHWVGAFCKFLWNGFWTTSPDSHFSKLGDEIRRHLEHRMSFKFNDELATWVEGMKAVILDPFKTAIGLLLGSFVIYLGAKLLASRSSRDVTYESAVRVGAYAMAPSILLAVPWVGGPLNWLLGAALMIIGSKEVYRTSWPIGFCIAFFPMILLMVWGFTMVAMGLLFVASFFTLFFH